MLEILTYLAMIVAVFFTIIVMIMGVSLLIVACSIATGLERIIKKFN